jgi:hypothetical protein
MRTAHQPSRRPQVSAPPPRLDRPTPVRSTTRPSSSSHEPCGGRVVDERAGSPNRLWRRSGAGPSYSNRCCSSDHSLITRRARCSRHPNGARSPEYSRASVEPMVRERACPVDWAAPRGPETLGTLVTSGFPASRGSSALSSRVRIAGVHCETHRTGHMRHPCAGRSHAGRSGSGVRRSILCGTPPSSHGCLRPGAAASSRRPRRRQMAPRGARVVSWLRTADEGRRQLTRL